MSIYDQNFHKHGLSSSQLKILEIVKDLSTLTSISILELGSSSGYMTVLLKEFGVIDIVDIDNKMLQKAKKYARKSFEGSLDDPDFLKKINGKYDVIIAADVFEHLKDPEQCLKHLRKCLKTDGSLIFSLPNIACWKIRKELFFNGFFEYQEIGMLDKTHLKFFTYNSIRKWLGSLNLRIKQIHLFEIDYPLRDTLLHLPLGRFITSITDKKMIKEYPNLSSAHMVIHVKV